VFSTLCATVPILRQDHWGIRVGPKCLFTKPLSEQKGHSGITQGSPSGDQSWQWNERRMFFTAKVIYIMFLGKGFSIARFVDLLESNHHFDPSYWIWRISLLTNSDFRSKGVDFPISSCGFHIAIHHPPKIRHRDFIDVINHYWEIWPLVRIIIIMGW